MLISYFLSNLKFIKLSNGECSSVVLSRIMLLFTAPLKLWKDMKAASVTSSHCTLKDDNAGKFN